MLLHSPQLVCDQFLSNVKLTVSHITPGAKCAANFRLKLAWLRCPAKVSLVVLMCVLLVATCSTVHAGIFCRAASLMRYHIDTCLSDCLKQTKM